MIRSKSNMRFQVLANFILILFTIFVITPFILLIMSSFTEESTLIRNGLAVLTLEMFRGGKIQLGSLCLHMEKCV